MKPRSTTLGVCALFTALVFAGPMTTAAGAVTVGAGATAFGLAKPGGGAVTGDAVSDIEVSVAFVPGFYVGATYSRFTTDGGEEWYYGGEFDHQTIGGFLIAEFLPTSALTPYARLGMSSVTTKVSETSEQSTTGAFAGLGARVYLKTLLSVSLEIQFQHLDLASEAAFEEREHVWRVLVGADLWWSLGK